MRTPFLPALLVPVALVGVLSLTGCSALQNAVERVHEESFASAAQAAEGWQGVAFPTWIPDDASEIHNLATADETNAVVRLQSSSPLPGACIEVDREGLPFDTRDWTPALDRFPDRVDRCGAYEVMPVDGGYLGWFTAQEEGQTPADVSG